MTADGGIHVAIGPLGSIGVALAAEVALAPRDQLTVISRRHAGSVRDFGLGCYGGTPSKWKAGKDLEVHSSLSDVKNSIDWLLCTAPAYALDEIACEISKSPAVTENTSVVLFNNGWPLSNGMAEVISAKRRYNAATMVGAVRRCPNVSEVTVNGGIMLGSLSGASLDAAQGLASAISEGGITLRLTDQIGAEIFRKIAFNCVCSLSALYRMRIGGLLQPQFDGRVRCIATETWHASIDAGHRSFETGTAAIDDMFARIRKAELHTASITKALINKELTENEVLCGAIAKIANSNGWFAAECTRVWQEIRAAEACNRTPVTVRADAEPVGAAR